jgi:hypothetical protein
MPKLVTALSAADCGVERDDDRVIVVGRAVATAAALVRPMAVEMFRVLGQDRGSMVFVVDRHPVGALGADRIRGQNPARLNWQAGGYGPSLVRFAGVPARG